MQNIFEDSGHDVFLRRAELQDMQLVHDLARLNISDEVASTSAMERVRRHNSDVAWMIGRKATGDIVGFYLFLFFTRDGLQAFESDEIDTLEPETRYLAAEGERPAALYLWGLVARGLTDRTFPLILQALPKERYAGLPILAKAATHGGAHKLDRYGFGRQNATGTGSAVGDTFRLNREPGYRPRNRPEGRP